jgi:hypothetical protein
VANPNRTLRGFLFDDKEHSGVMKMKFDFKYGDGIKQVQWVDDFEGIPRVSAIPYANTTFFYTVES